MNGTALLRLLQLASPGLPIGTFAYSQGLEQAVFLGWVRDEVTASDWILGLMRHGLGALEVPIAARLMVAWQGSDGGQVRRWSDHLYAARASAELQAEDRRLGGALARVLVTAGLAEAATWTDDPRATQLALFTMGCARWQIPTVAATEGYLFAWCEGQVGAACRLVPLGQSSGQRILGAAVAAIPAVVAAGLLLGDDEIGASAPSHAIAAALHETLYSRLFRS